MRNVGNNMAKLTAGISGSLWLFLVQSLPTRALSISLELFATRQERFNWTQTMSAPGTVSTLGLKCCSRPSLPLPHKSLAASLICTF